MNRENERPAASNLATKYVGDFARLPQIEAVEWLVHQQYWMWRQQGQCQKEAAVIALRQRTYALLQHWAQPHRSDRISGLNLRSPVNRREKRNDVRSGLILIGTHTIRKIKEGLAPLRGHQRFVMPKNLTGIRGNETSSRFQQSGLACAIWSDDAEHFSRPCREGHVIDGAFLAISFRQINDS